MKQVSAVSTRADDIALIDHVRRPFGDKNYLYARYRLEDVFDEYRDGVHAIEIISIGNFIIDEPRRGHLTQLLEDS